jgi:aldose 1-epimerase
MGVTNRGARSMPFGLGQHPYWPRENDVTLRFRSTHFWLERPDCIATDRITIPRELDFAVARGLPKTWRNNDYAGWDGVAEIEFGRVGVGLRIEADPIFRHLMLYCDPDQAVFCLEPQTHVVGAFNRLQENDAQDLGVVILEPGESMRGSVSYWPYDWAKSHS